MKTNIFINTFIYNNQLSIFSLFNFSDLIKISSYKFKEIYFIYRQLREVS